jgi:hypothetical protein
LKFLVLIENLQQPELYRKCTYSFHFVVKLMHNQTKFLIIAATLAAAIVSVTLYTAATTANAQGTNMTKNAAGRRLVI